MSRGLSSDCVVNINADNQGLGVGVGIHVCEPTEDHRLKLPFAQLSIAGGLGLVALHSKVPIIVRGVAAAGACIVGINAMLVCDNELKGVK